MKEFEIPTVEVKELVTEEITTTGGVGADSTYVEDV